MIVTSEAILNEDSLKVLGSWGATNKHIKEFVSIHLQSICILGNLTLKRYLDSSKVIY